ncbi:uncharacterized protein LOC114276618 [Camellia sinensis]|uniref:uncharacterized protein LOC114276618 n=1 Tax=Camellia sinensis TaxID=4442 RepID=UPI00103685EB|nr:uncharacterized protein LOC114276618 [Camellia sinensis]
MEHPHNAILLPCSSHEKGCCPYMCDTSQCHSNCFDHFMNSKTRSCSLENYDFSRTYSELRKHARLKHPFVQSSEDDPKRQSD